LIERQRVKEEEKKRGRREKKRKRERTDGGFIPLLLYMPMRRECVKAELRNH
jgi:hypothetical protein